MDEYEAVSQTGRPAPILVSPPASRSSHSGFFTGAAVLGSASGGVPSASEILAGIIDAEILPQLRTLHRPDPAGAEGCSAEAVRLARFLLGDRDGFQALLAGYVARCAPWPVIASNLLVPAARGLGALWAEDMCDFLDVAEAVGWLQVATQNLLRPDLSRVSLPDPRRILLAPLPGEMHRYGLSLTAGFFRDAGWAVTIASSPDDRFAGLAAVLKADRYDVLGLSLACDIHVPLLRQSVPLLRRASRNPDLRVIVGGELVARGGTDARTLGVEACVADGAQAPAIASDLLHRVPPRAISDRERVEQQPFR